MTAAAPAFPPKATTQIRLVDSENWSDTWRVVLQTDGPGVHEVPALNASRIAIHVGRPVRMDCRHGARRHSGLAIHGDIDIIPNETPSRWEMKEADTALVIKLGSNLLGQVAEECGVHRPTEIRSQFRLRDASIEHIGWALLAEIERGYPSGRLYMDCLAAALAVQLLRNHSSAAVRRFPAKGGMPRHKLRKLQCYIEEHLRSNLSLDVIADAAGMSPSHLKTTFRQATGMPVHQYLIHRRVERAAWLLREGQLPISRVALDVGFAHQSHLAMHMRRLLGVLPHHFTRSIA
jgi:AraC family transcriptional regulator